MKKAFLLLIALGLAGCMSVPVEQGARLDDPWLPVATKFEPAFVQAGVGEPVELTLYLLTRRDVRYLGVHQETKSEDLEITYLPYRKASQMKIQTVRWNGMKYIKTNILKVRLVPKKAGKYELDLGKIKIKHRRDKEFPWTEAPISTPLVPVDVL